MPKVKVKLREMLDGRVDFISLVDRAASRMPIRVMKREEETGMLDLALPHLLFQAKKADAPKPQVSALVTFDHGEGQALVEKALTEQGWDVSRALKQEDGTVLYEQTENPTEGARIVKMSDELLLVVKGFDSYCWSPTGSADFGDLIQAQNFQPSVSTAGYVLSTAISDALYKSTTVAEAKTKVQEVLKQFNTYVLGLVEGLPSKAFKADEAVTREVKAYKQEQVRKAEAKKAEEVSPSGAETQGQAATEVAADSGAQATEGAQTGGESVNKGESATDTGSASGSEASTGVVEKSEHPDLTELLSAIKSLSGSVEEISKKMETFGSELTRVSEAQKASELALDSAVKKADTLDNKLKSVVLGAAPADPVKAVKQEVVTQRLPTNYDSAIHGRQHRR